jgi:hypothetical protein
MLKIPRLPKSSVPFPKLSDGSKMRRRDYLLDRFKESIVKARVIVDALLFVLFFVSGGVTWNKPEFHVEKPILVLAAGVFFVAFLIEICFISPFNHARKLQDKFDRLQKVLDWTKDNRAHRRKEMRHALFLDYVSKIKQDIDPLGRLQQIEADEFFETNADLNKFCDELVEQKHPHPFTNIAIRESDRLEFLKTARLRGNDLRDGDEVMNLVIDLTTDVKPIS